MSSFFTASSYVGLVDSRSHTRSSSYDRVSLYPTITTVVHDDEMSTSTSNFTMPSSLNPSTYTGTSRHNSMSFVNSSPNAFENEKIKGKLISWLRPIYLFIFKYVNFEPHIFTHFAF